MGGSSSTGINAEELEKLKASTAFSSREIKVGGRGVWVG